MVKIVNQMKEETKKKIGLANKGRKPSVLAIQNSIKARKGKKLSQNHREKLSKCKKGITPSNFNEMQKKSWKDRTGRIGYWFGKKRTYKNPPERNKKISEALSGAKHWNWLGGNKSYSVDWTQTLKRSIRERDKYICCICGSPQNDRALDVHHIDYNKKNCNPDNLISLCNSCHIKTNFNRNYWTNLFKKYDK